MLSCQGCGMELEGSELYCPWCGIKLEFNETITGVKTGSLKALSEQKAHDHIAEQENGAEVNPSTVPVSKQDRTTGLDAEDGFSEGVNQAQDFLERKKKDHQFAMKVQKCANENEFDELLKQEGYSFTDKDLKIARGEAVAGPDPDIEEDLTSKLKGELRGWGIGLIILGFLHFILADFLDPLWGLIILVVGVLNLVIINPNMLIVNGLALILVGLMNIINTLLVGGSGWLIFGGLQIYWGVLEIMKFGKYKSAG